MESRLTWRPVPVQVSNKSRGFCPSDTRGSCRSLTLPMAIVRVLYSWSLQPLAGAESLCTMIDNTLSAGFVDPRPSFRE